MKKILAIALALVVLAAPAANAVRTDGVPVYFKSDNVEYIGFVPLENDRKSVV